MSYLNKHVILVASLGLCIGFPSYASAENHAARLSSSIVKSNYPAASVFSSNPQTPQNGN